MGTSGADLKKLSKLAQLEIPDQQFALLEQKIKLLIGFFDELKKLPTHGIEPLYSPIEKIEFREDKSQAPETSSAILANAPQVHDGMYALPRILGESS